MECLQRLEAAIRMEALRLEVDGVEARPVLLDDAVDPSIAAATDGFSRVPMRAAIAHGDEQIDDQALEVRR